MKLTTLVVVTSLATGCTAATSALGALTSSKPTQQVTVVTNVPPPPPTPAPAPVVIQATESSHLLTTIAVAALVGAGVGVATGLAVHELAD